MKYVIDVPRNFSFWYTVYSHGWCSLPPFNVDKDRSILSMAVATTPRSILPIEITCNSRKQLIVELPNRKAITAREKEAIERTVKACFRLDEDYSTFYAEVKGHKQFHWVRKRGAGRLLRSPTVFEDAVKMMCTTNCSWGLTTSMVTNLCTKLGTEYNEGKYSFPSPEVIADCTEKYIRKEIRAGYRSPYILELARRAARKEINLDSWRSSDAPSAELFEEVRSVKGLGPYAAGNILKLLGRYDYLAIDSWCRKQFCEIHKKKTVSDKYIERYYESFGKWKGLFFWLELTKNWYEKKFPF